MQAESEGMKIFHTNANQKKVWVFTLNIRENRLNKNCPRVKDSLYIMIRESIQWKDTTTISKYALTCT